MVTRVKSCPGMRDLTAEVEGEGREGEREAAGGGRGWSWAAEQGGQGAPRSNFTGSLPTRGRTNRNNHIGMRRVCVILHAPQRVGRVRHSHGKNFVCHFLGGMKLLGFCKGTPPDRGTTAAPVPVVAVALATIGSVASSTIHPLPPPSPVPLVPSSFHSLSPPFSVYIAHLRIWRPEIVTAAFSTSNGLCDCSGLR